MKMTRRTACLIAAFLLIGAVELTTAGCGGGGPESGVASRTSPFVTRAAEESYLPDTLALAATDAPEGFIPTATANAVQSDLQQIRARYPDLADVTMASRGSQRQLYLRVLVTGPVAQAWAQGKTLTGLAPVDAVLTRYKVESIDQIDLDSMYFRVRFTDPLNLSKVRTDLTQAANRDSLNVTDPLPVPEDSTEEPHLGLNGTKVIQRNSTETGRIYRFIRGYGDCASGCMQAHTRIVIIGNDGKISLEETGAPPGGDYRY